VVGTVSVGKKRKSLIGFQNQPVEVRSLQRIKSGRELM
jgi:hypothetical protein